jgi:hypothetical protein
MRSVTATRITLEREEGNDTSADVVDPLRIDTAAPLKRSASSR